MHNIQQVRSATEQRWQSALRKVWQQVELLTDSYMATATALLPYRAGSPDLDAARSRARASYEYMLRELMDIPIPEEISDLPRTVALSWARNELPLDVLMQVTHLDYKIIWDALLWHTTKQDLPMLAVNADRVWSVVHAYSLKIQAAYAQETALIARARLDKQREFVARLFSAAAPSAQVLDGIAAALDVPLHGRFEIAAVPREEHDRLTSLAEGLRLDGLHAFVHGDGESLAVFVHVPASAEVLAPRVGALRCVVPSAVTTFAEVRGQVLLALRAASHLPDAGPCGLVDVWDSLVAEDLQDWSPALCAEFLGELATRDDGEADRLLATARAYLGTGSVAATAQRMYCHRNTVVNRLRAFRELTGLDLTVPREAAAVVVALACARRRPSAGPDAARPVPATRPGGVRFGMQERP